MFYELKENIFDMDEKINIIEIKERYKRIEWKFYK